MTCIFHLLLFNGNWKAKFPEFGRSARVSVSGAGRSSDCGYWFDLYFLIEVQADVLLLAFQIFALGLHRSDLRDADG